MEIKMKDGVVVFHGDGGVVFVPPRYKGEPDGVVTMHMRNYKIEYDGAEGHPLLTVEFILDNGQLTMNF
jgi:hypothetical protein